MKIPFWLLPVAWGLKGKSRLKAEAEYYYSGEDLDRELALIDANTEKEKFISLLEVDLKYNKINQYQFDKTVAEHEYYETDKEKNIALLEIDLAHNKVTKHEYDRKHADINEQPYVNVVKMDIDKKDTHVGFFELDWNEQFIDFLIDKGGYRGASNEDIINKWMNDICRTIIIQEEADQDYGLKNINKRPDVEVVYRRNEESTEHGDITEQGE